ALDRTTAAGTFHLAYHLTATPTAPPGTVCRSIPVPRGLPTSTFCSTTGPPPVDTSGDGTITVSPKSMVTAAHVGSGLDVTLRLSGDQVWESGGGEYGGPPSGPGQPLSGFAQLVESTLGPRAGALAMTRMASPNAYLALEQRSITGATPAGTSSVDGTPVTN